MSRGIEMMQPFPLTMTFFRTRGTGARTGSEGVKCWLGGAGSGLSSAPCAGLLTTVSGLLGGSCTDFGDSAGVNIEGEIGDLSACALRPLDDCVSNGPAPEACLECVFASGTAYFDAIILLSTSFSSLLKWRQKSC
tara:strand:- start:7736 stop:8143 length:408 start_codon:yes stop_codon:yes gene_type:complete